MSDTKRLIYIIIILLTVNLSVTTLLLVDKFVEKPPTVATPHEGSMDKRSITNNAEFKQGYFLSLQPPSPYAVGGPSVLNNTYEIPPLNTSSVYVVAYYNAGQEINLTKASGLQGLSIDKWGFSYFDGTYIFHDPTGVPTSETEAYANSTVGIHVRVRSDGWVLAWIWQNQSLSTIVMSGLSISEIGSKQPWVNKTVTTPSYTIYKTLEQAGIASGDDNDGDGVPDDLVTISQNTGYYDYKYCGPQGKIGFLAILGTKDQVSGVNDNSKSSTKMLDFITGGMYNLKEYIVTINLYLYVRRGDGSVSATASIYMNTTTDFQEPILHISEGSGLNQYQEKKIYMIRHKLQLPFNIVTNQLYYTKQYLYASEWHVCNPGRAEIHVELYVVMIGVLK